MNNKCVGLFNHKILKLSYGKALDNEMGFCHIRISLDLNLMTISGVPFRAVMHSSKQAKIQIKMIVIIA